MSTEGYVYRIIAPGSNSVYVGQSVDPRRRFSVHKSRPCNPALTRFLKKHPDAEMYFWFALDMNAEEIADAQLCKDMGFNLLNCIPCGERTVAMLGNKSRTGMKHTEETKRKISESQKKIDRSGNVFSTEFREASRLAKLGRPRSADVRAKISKAKSGKPWSPARRAAQERKVG